MVGVGTGVGVKVVAGNPKSVTLGLAMMLVEVGTVEEREGENRNGKPVLPDADALELTEGKMLEMLVGRARVADPVEVMAGEAADEGEPVPVAKTVVGIQFVPRSSWVETDVVVTVTVTVAAPDAAATVVLVGLRVKSETRVTGVSEVTEEEIGAIVGVTRGAEEEDMVGKIEALAVGEETTENSGTALEDDTRESAGGTRSKAWRRY